MEQRSSVFDEMKNTDGELKEYLKSTFSKHMANQQFYEWIDSLVERGNLSNP